MGEVNTRSCKRFPIPPSLSPANHTHPLARKMTPRCQKQKRTVLHPSLDPHSVIVLRVQTQAGKEGSGRTLHQADLPPPPHQACLLPTPSSLFLLTHHQHYISLLFFPVSNWQHHAVTDKVMCSFAIAFIGLNLCQSGYSSHLLLFPQSQPLRISWIPVCVALPISGC